MIEIAEVMDGLMDMVECISLVGRIQSIFPLFLLYIIIIMIRSDWSKYIYIMFIIFVENVTLSIMILNNSSNMANCIANYTRIITTWFMLRLLMKLTVAKYTCTVSPLNQWTICLSLEVKLPYDPVCPSSARLMVGLSLFPLKSFTSILLSEHL